ncbi:CylE protein [Streptococcus equinus]|uniref:CylE protein n=1 Tax=Streptococcus equinus TaxID=1335 RepID=A0A1H0QPC9_STREI|nr:hypothetical protein [Streptococcus equinus]SDP19194.1 CylE protein [Streptococcus equinus]
MKEEHPLEISQACPADYPEIVALFNKNKVYQFPDGNPLCAEDFDLTMKVKEVQPFFLLRQQNKLIGTSAFFKFITLECLDWNSSFSGFLLIDSENRSGQAISYLYRAILERIAELGFSNLFTEISKYNKPSLSLSRLNGFHEFSQTYEDILHCRLLRSNLPKVIKTFWLSDYHGKTYDISTFEILEEVEDVTNQETLIRTQISDEELVFKVQDQASLPYFLKMDLFQLAVVKENGRYFLEAHFFSDDVEKIQAKIGHRFVCLGPNHCRCTLGKGRRSYKVQAKILTKHGTIAVQLEYRSRQIIGKTQLLKQDFQGYRLKVSPEGDLLFCKNQRVIFSDTFIMFSKPLESTYKIIEKKAGLDIIWSYQGARICKKIRLAGHHIMCSYSCNRKAEAMMPELLKQGFRIFCQEQLLKDGHHYLANRPGYYPLEHDDFLRASQFVQENFEYDIPSEGYHISYQPLAKASNQMQFRPLSLCQASDLNGASYQISFEARDFGKEDSFDKELYPASKKDLLKYISKLCLEEEFGYGTKHLIKNRKTFAIDSLVLAHNQLVLPENAIPKDCQQASLSFTLKMKGNLEQLRFSERISYQNKAHILENQGQLVIYDEKQDRYVQLLCPDGVFYSYKENNSLKIRCVFDTAPPHTINVRLTEYKRS